MRIVPLAAAGAAALATGVLVAPTASGAQPHQAGKPFTIEMTGAAEVPGPGDPDATGTARLWVNPGQERVCYELTVDDVDGTVSGAHIHVGSVDEAGPVVVGLTPPVDGFSKGCVPVDRDLARSLITDRDNYYVNVHSRPDFVPGAVRGQLG